MAQWIGLRNVAARGAMCVALFALGALVLPGSASAAAQLTSFSVTSPPPPSSEPGQPSHSSSTHALAIAGNDLPTNDPTVGTMAGQASTDAGAAMYTVPIVVPPGRMGMQPSLSLSYSSRSGNGVMGVGWTISGLSSIHRCPQTPEQDGQTLGVAYSTTDRLCLDGQRLVLYSGQYGQTGAHYRTEVDSYADVVQDGPANGNLQSVGTYFVVQERDGRVLTYGQLSNAQAIPSGAPAPFSWLVQQIQDRVGNNQIYTYATSQGSDIFGAGEVLLSTVAYTGSGGSAGNRTVTFSYETRTTANGSATDVSSRYLAGGLTMQTQALASITTAVNGTTARTYTPKYTYSQYSGRLLMASLAECAYSGGSPTCHPATAFTYNDDVLNTRANFPVTSFNALALPAPAASTQTTAPYGVDILGDLSGSGTKMGAVVEYEASDGKQHTFLLQTTADRKASSVDLTGTPFSVNPADYVDIDGAGRSVLIERPSTAGTLSFGVWGLARNAIATGNPFVTATSNIPFDPTHPPNDQNQVIYAADIDGDGKTDIVIVQQDSACGSDAIGPLDAVHYYKNTTQGALSASNPATFQSGVKLFCLPRQITSVSGSTIGFHEATIDHIADFDGNGLPDFYLIYVGIDSQAGSFVGIETTALSGGTLTSTLIQPLHCDNSANNTDDECNWQDGYVTHWMDVNGDGLEDFVIARANQGVWQVRLNQGNGTLAPAITATGTGYQGLDNFSSPTQNSGYAFRYANSLPVMDVDGDGKTDILIPSQTQGFALKMCVMTALTPNLDGTCPPSPGGGAAPTGNSPATSQICPAYACPEDPGSTAATLPANPDSTHNKIFPYEWNGQPAYGVYSGDTNNNMAGNGKSDPSVYHLAMLKFVQTGPSSVTVSTVETPLVSRLNQNIPAVESVFGDGLPDLLTSAGCTNSQITINGISYNRCAVVGTENGTQYGPTTFPDGTPTANFATSPSLYANVNQGTATLGGSLALRTTGSFAPLTIQSTPNTVSLNLNPPTLPGLLFATVNGVGDEALWVYDPLSMPGAQDGIPLYTVPSTGGYQDDRNYYFQSSMPVVVGMAQNSGDGPLAPYYTGFRSVAYGYAEAIYNHFGRGFAGFHQIIAESGDGTDTTGKHYRATRTTTTYNQKFPLIGKVAEVQTSARDVETASNVVVRDENDYYICTLSNRGACPQDTAIAPNPTNGGTVYAPVLDNQTTATFDLGTGSQDAEVDTTNANGSVSGWDAYGNLTYQTVNHYDAGSSLFVSSATTTTQNAFDYSQVGNWWLNKLSQSSVTSTIAYASGHPLPASASAPSQTVTTNFSWNADRTPSTKTVQSGYTNQQSVATYCYPQATTTTSPSCPQTTQTTSYGLPTLTKVCLGYYDANGNCSGAKGTGNGDPGSALSPERTTGFSYTSDGSTASADGYFVLTTKNALSQITTTLHDPNDGAVVTTKDPNGVQIIDTRDAFGRVLDVQHLGNNSGNIESMIQSAYNSCLDTSNNPGHCSSTLVGEDPAGFTQEANAAYRVTTVQAGYPTQVTWYDLLGHKVKQAHRGFDGTFIVIATEYDDMGTAAFTSSPYFLGTSAYFTGRTYDALNRPTQKIAPASEMDPTHGDLETDYTYSGRTTNLTVHGTKITLGAGNTCPASAKNLCLQMSRSQNVLGQWMQTTQSPILNGTTTTLTTNYWTEPLGHVAAMKDAEGNITTALYNPIGQRTSSSDPDQGTWSFQYDALGELLSQTDARGVVTTINSRDALGRTTERQEVPPGSVTGLAYETELDDWSFDPANGIGELGQVQRRRGTGTTVPAQTATPVWQEVYTYEQTTARPSTITTTINESGNVVLSTGMDYDTDGRPNTHTYPSGLIVQNGYTSYGQLDELSNKSTGAAYWTATAANEWEHVTGETFTGSITGSHQDYHSTGQAYQLSWAGEDKFLYGYDSFGNLVSQSRSGNASNGESFQYDPLQRLTQSARTTGAAVNYGYTASGNLAYKDNFSVNSGTGTPAYSYASANSFTNNCGPHAANAVSLPGNLTATYTCDKNGNVIGGNTISATFDADNHPRTLTRTNLTGGVPYEPCATNHPDTIFCDGFEVLPKTQTTGNATWAYDSNGNRYFESSALQGTRYFGPGGYELASGTAKQELGPVIVTGNGASTTVVLRDRLGSTLDTIDGTSLAQRAYAPFGATRNGDMSDRQYGMLNLTPDTIHGFTNHTHEDDVALIHMGGRIYDYNLGRFLSVDPLVVSPLSSQGLNPYSYIGNNPLAGKDPTGFAACSTGTNFTGDNGPSCADLGVSVTQVGSPSVTENNDAIAKSLGQQADHVATTPASAYGSSSGAMGQGANSIKQVAAADVGNPTTDLASRPDGNVSSTGNNGGNSDLGIMGGCPPNCPEPEKGLEPVGFAGVDNIAIDLASYGRTVQDNGFFSKAAGIGLLGLGLDAITFGRAGGAASDAEALLNPYAGIKDASAYLQAQGVSRSDRVTILQSFNAEGMSVRQAGASEFGIRYFSDPARPGGAYLFETFPASRGSLAIKPEWSTMSGFKQFQVRPGATLFEGTAARQGPYLPGGQTQMYIPDWRNNLLEPK